MTFSPQLEARFAKLLASYPPGRERSAMIPMLLYAQRTGVTPLQVNEVISYYTMLRRKPAGKYHVQVCTNVSCLLRDGDRLFEHACKKLGLDNHGVTPDGQFSIEEVECMGACSWAPAVQVNYAFHHDVTPEKLDRLLDELKEKR